jgi:hypothetical protein
MRLVADFALQALHKHPQVQLASVIVIVGLHVHLQIIL